MRPGLNLFLMLCAGLAAAETPRLLSPEEHLQWQAIGRVNQAGFRSRSLCSGTLIAPDKVLTAAHCFNPRRTDPVVFVAGWYRGEKAASREASVIHVAQGFQLGARPSLEMIAADWALLVLSEPITEVVPIPFALLEDGAPVELIAYSGKRPHALSSRGPCPSQPDTAGVVWLGCASMPGNSGGPVLQQVDGAWRVVGVVSAVTRHGGTLAVAPLRGAQEITR